MQASCWLKPKPSLVYFEVTFTAFVTIRLLFLFSFYVCLAQAYTLSASSTQISVASTYASPLRDKKTTTCLCLLYCRVPFGFQCTVCRPAENKTDCWNGLALPLPLLLFLYRVNKRLLPVLAEVPKPGATVPTVEAVWMTSEPERQREGNAKPDRCVLWLRNFGVFNCGAQNSKQQVYSRVLFSFLFSFFLAAWRAHDEFPPPHSARLQTTCPFYSWWISKLLQAQTVLCV